MASTGEIRVEQKREALDSVLGSRTFDRSDQLRALLRFVGEEELAGRGGELTEYRIGVEGLGRPADFSPLEDSMVRNRVFALRKKLDDYYVGEGREAGLRVELPKGSYVPRYVMAVAVASLVAVAVPAASVRPAVVSRRGLLTGGIFGAVLGGAAAWMAARAWDGSAVPGVIRRAWGPLLAQGALVRLVVATPPTTFVRPYPVTNPNIPGLVAATPEIRAWYLDQRMDQDPPVGLFEVPNRTSPLWGDAVGVFRLSQILTQARVEHQLLAERLVTTPALRGGNVVFFGSPEYSPSVARLLEKAPFQIGFGPAGLEHVIYERKADGTDGARWVPTRSKQGAYSEVYGLITILPADGDTEGAHRYVAISGISSAGTEAACDFFASPLLLGELERKLGGRWPKALQVVVRARTNRVVALGSEYADHRVLAW